MKLPTLKQAYKDLKPFDAVDWALLFMAAYFIYRAIFS
jgi:hypothetical protein